MTSRAALLCWSQKFQYNEAENTNKSASGFLGQHPAIFQPGWRWVTAIGSLDPHCFVYVSTTMIFLTSF